MSKKLFVGNLPWSTTEEDLTQLFSEFGEIEDVFVVRDRATNRSRGFAFVTFAKDAEADQAVEKLHDHDMQGRKLVVNEARPPREKAY